jgi:predicted transcriptional regulator
VPVLSKNLTVLYVVNVFQPISFDHVYQESIKVINDMGLKREAIEATLNALTTRQLIIKNSEGKYSCTGKGLQRIARLGLWRVRDKNRMLVMADLMKRR